jgi:PEP-CTERM motif
MNLRDVLLTAGLASAVAFAANAALVESDIFNDGSASNTNWAGDSQFSSLSSFAPYGGGSNASTDYVSHSNPYGITCFGPDGCVDLDGSTGSGNDPAGVFESITSFGAGSYTLNFELSGNQRGAAAQATDVYFGSQLIFSSGDLASNAPWTLEHVTFTSAGGGNLTFVEVGPSDQQGNLLGDVALFSDTPEPATWALMILGMAGLGGMLRRRSRAMAV